MLDILLVTRMICGQAAPLMSIKMQPFQVMSFSVILMASFECGDGRADNVQSFVFVMLHRD